MRGVYCITFVCRALTASRYGTTKEHFAKVAEKNHRHSVNNPYAQFQEPYSLDQILSSKEICPPLTVSYSRSSFCVTSFDVSAIMTLIIIGLKMILQKPTFRPACSDFDQDTKGYLFVLAKYTLAYKRPLIILYETSV